MQEWQMKSERNVRRQKDANYTDTGWVKSKSSKNELLSDAQNYKYQDCCEMHEWIRECEKKKNKQNSLKCICIDCVKLWSGLNKKWVDALENKIK